MTRKTSPAFTLIELLVVVAIMAILLTFVIPAASNMLGGTNINKATQTVVDQLTLARQSAITLNRPVEVRFYQYHDPETPGTSSCFRALQAWEVVKAGSYIPLEKVQSLPTGIIMDRGTTSPSNTLSSLFYPNGAVLGPPGPASIPRVGTQYSYVAIHFTPSAATDLLPTGGASGSWFITLHAELSGDALTTPPPNFVTIQIDPVSGTLQFFRPGVSSS
jgi:uncharacterized protein (TIGR02596 family)